MTIAELNEEIRRLQPLLTEAKIAKFKHKTTMEELLPHMLVNQMGYEGKDKGNKLLNIAIAVFLQLPSYKKTKKEIVRVKDVYGVEHSFEYDHNFYAGSEEKRDASHARYTEYKARYLKYRGLYEAAVSDEKEYQEQIDILQGEIIEAGLRDTKVQEALAKGGHTIKSVMEREKQKGTTDRARNEGLKEGELAVLHAEAKKLEMEAQAKTKKQKALATLGIAGGVIILLVVLGFIIKKFKKRKAA